MYPSFIAFLTSFDNRKSSTNGFVVSDGFVEKLGQDPVIYGLTEKGKNIEII